MKITDAANILGLTGIVTSNDIKKAYRTAALKYHPDKNPAGIEMMKIINAAFDVLKNFSGEIPNDEEQTATQDYGEAVSQALTAIINLVDLSIEICGAWVWVSGETFQHKTVLKEAGFKYASKKQSWYYRPENWRSKSRGSYSMDDIRNQYGSSTPVKSKNKALTTS